MSGHSKQLARFEARSAPASTGYLVKASSDGCRLTKRCTSRSTTPPACYVEVLADEQKENDRWIPGRAVGWFSEQGITCRGSFSDNGPLLPLWRLAKKPVRAFGSQAHFPHQALHAADQRGKGERFIKNHLAEWAFTLTPTKHRMNATAATPLSGGIYNGRQVPHALGGLTPQQLPSSGFC